MARNAPLPLAQLLQSQFSLKTRSKGAGYFSGSAIRRFQGNDTCVSAKVDGNDLYEVDLQYDKDANELKCGCTCPAFDSGPCKHLWAVILKADAENKLALAREHQCQYLVPAYFDNAGLEEIPDEDDYFNDHKSDADILAQILAPLGGPAAVAKLGGPNALAKLLPKKVADLLRFQGNKAGRHGGNMKQLPPQPPPPPKWQTLLDRVRAGLRSSQEGGGFWAKGRQVLYIIDAGRILTHQTPAIEIAVQDIKMNGEPAKPREHHLSAQDIRSAPDANDRRALQTLRSLRGAVNSYSYSYYNDYESLKSPVPLPDGSAGLIVPLLCATGRCWLRRGNGQETELHRMRWDDGPAWELVIDVHRDERKKEFVLAGQLRRPQELMPLSAPLLLLRGGVLFTNDTAARFDDRDAFEWISLLRDNPEIRVPAKDGDRLVESLATMPRQPALALPEELKVEEVQVTPRPRLSLLKGKAAYDADMMHAAVTFDYEGVIIAASHQEESLYQSQNRRLIRRDRAFETNAVLNLRTLGFRDLASYYQDSKRQMEIKAKKVPAAAAQLIAAGWFIEAEGKPYRSAGKIDIKVASGIDWFELHGEAHFDDQTIELPRLLEALRRKENSVVLGDGTIGMLPEEWLKKYGTLAAMGDGQQDHIRFSHAQVGLLDALLASMPEATCDEVFKQARDRLRKFEGVAAADAPQGFGGELRPYQREGLGWLHFLREFRFGGCLADDMGLGKTIQVLALLEARRQEKLAAPSRQGGASAGNSETDALAAPDAPPCRDGAPAAPDAPPCRDGARRDGAPAAPRPSLVVLPRSLVFNWQQEAAKFTPQLRVLDHTGIDRICRGEGDHAARFDEYDLILTTYGTLRSDAAQLKDVRFDYLILDEAQAIKNANTISAKAVRLLQGNHRLVMTGTPVENRLADLWSLFEFLNPGMLGGANVFKMLGGGDAGGSDEARALLSRALRPFILRRKKEQVAKDLPARVEQTVYCDLEPKQRKYYNQLREHYRRSLLKKVADVGMNKSKMHVLEALLRLRQAACHPGLIDEKLAKDSSAKIDALLPQLQEVIEEGHKALVFSQFTSLLAIVRHHLDKEGIVYEYLDGQTTDRQARVERFQTDPKCPLFLISLKAGGVGLNLTAAEHVFLLDPWWNPAVEAQAIDRAHRIGQQRQVFAFRLIARDTVEEKVLELQNSKRELADAIINQDNSLISKLGREELELLLS